MKGFFQFVLGSIGACCTHRRRSRVFRDIDGQYQRCLECGKRLEYNKIEFVPCRTPSIAQSKAYMNLKRENAGA